MSVIRFGEFELDEQTLELRKDGVLTRIQQQPARVLAFLLNHRGSLVTREQIRLAIWGEDTFVDFEQGLNFCIRQIRLALNDEAERPLHIVTLSLPRSYARSLGPRQGEDIFRLFLERVGCRRDSLAFRSRPCLVRCCLFPSGADESRVGILRFLARHRKRLRANG